MAITRYTFRGQLVLDGALHIGSGGGGANRAGAAPVDATVVRDSSGQPYIPGSSLRGALRARIGQIGPLLAFSEIREDHDILPHVNAAILDEKDRLARQIPPANLDETRLQTLLNDPNILTPAERLFGTVFWESPFRIFDLYPDGKQSTAAEIRHGVGIDRDTGAAHDGAKYDFEVLPRDMRFLFRATLEIVDVPPAHVLEWRQLLGLAFRLLELGEIVLGGLQARGIGQVHLEHLEVDILDFSRRDQVLALLRRIDRTSGERQASGWAARQLEGMS